MQSVSLQLRNTTKLSTEPRCHAICMRDVIGVPTQDILGHIGLNFGPQRSLRTKTEGQPPHPKRNPPQNQSPEATQGPHTGLALIQARPHDCQCDAGALGSLTLRTGNHGYKMHTGRPDIPISPWPAAASGVTGAHAEQHGDPLPTLEARPRACRNCRPHAASADHACAYAMRTMR